MQHLGVNKTEAVSKAAAANLELRAEAFAARLWPPGAAPTRMSTTTMPRSTRCALPARREDSILRFEPWRVYVAKTLAKAVESEHKASR